MAIRRRRHSWRVRGKLHCSSNLLSTQPVYDKSNLAASLDISDVRTLSPSTPPILDQFPMNNSDIPRPLRYPLDVVKSRLQLQSGKATGADAYTGMVDCFQKIVRNEG
jgi:hypothetical protein